MEALHLTNDNFQDEVINSSVPVLVDFSASWCGPCKMVAPAVEQLADELSPNVKVAKIDIDECMEIAQQFRVMSVPTFILFKNGQPVDQTAGAMPKNMLKDFATK